jgi:hypothetical protein
MDQRTAGPLASRVRYAGLRPPLTPTARQPESCITHSKFKRGMIGKVRKVLLCNAPQLHCFRKT